MTNPLFLNIGSYPEPLDDLPSNLPSAMKAYLDARPGTNLYQILDYRYGLNRKKALTLEEIGALLRVTRERIRQKESKAIKYLRDGLQTIPLLDLEININLLHEIRALQKIVRSIDGYVEERALFEFIELRYGHNLSHNERAHLFVLFEIYDFERIVIPKCRPFWRVQNDELTRDDLAKVCNRCEKILREEVVPLSYTDLLIALAKWDRKMLLDDETFRFVLNVNEQIEALPNDYFQIYFARLKGAPDMAYRVLWEHGEQPMHSDKLAREINHRLVTAGEKPLTKGTVVNSMSRFPDRFVTIGKSGIWGLPEWDLVQSTIVEAMVKCFHEFKRPATAGEVYNCVKKYRTDAKRTKYKQINSFE